MRYEDLSAEQIGNGEMKGDLRRTRGSRPSRRSFRQDRGMIGASSGTNQRGWDPGNLKYCLAGHRPRTLSYPHLQRRV